MDRKNIGLHIIGFNFQALNIMIRYLQAVYQQSAQSGYVLQTSDTSSKFLFVLGLELPPHPAVCRDSSTQNLLAILKKTMQTRINFFACRIFIFLLLKSNNILLLKSKIKVREDTQ